MDLQDLPPRVHRKNDLIVFLIPWTNAYSKCYRSICGISKALMHQLAGYMNLGITHLSNASSGRMTSEVLPKIVLSSSQDSQVSWGVSISIFFWRSQRRTLNPFLTRQWRCHSNFTPCPPTASVPLAGVVTIRPSSVFTSPIKPSNCHPPRSQPEQPLPPSCYHFHSLSAPELQSPIWIARLPERKTSWAKHNQSPGNGNQELFSLCMLSKVPRKWAKIASKSLAMRLWESQKLNYAEPSWFPYVQYLDNNNNRTHSTFFIKLLWAPHKV